MISKPGIVDVPTIALLSYKLREIVRPRSGRRGKNWNPDLLLYEAANSTGSAAVRHPYLFIMRACSQRTMRRSGSWAYRRSS